MCDQSFDGSLTSLLSCNYGRTWGRTKFQTYAEVESVVQDVEMNNGSFSGNDFYTWTPAQRTASKDLGDKWTDAINNIGGLGYAYYDKDGILDAPMLARVKDALYDAFTELGSIIPIETLDYMSDSDFAALDNQWLKEVSAAGFMDATIIDKQGVTFSDLTHQWTFSDALTLPAAEMTEFLHQDILSSDAQTANRAQQAMDGLYYSLSTAFALHLNELQLGYPGARWGDLLDTNVSTGVWSDANMGHRSRMWIAMLCIVQDYNRPITYIPYWYDNFNFTKYEDLWGKFGEDVEEDQARLRKLHSFTLIPGFSPSGVFSDVRSIVRNGFPRKKKYDLSGQSSVSPCHEADPEH